MILTQFFREHPRAALAFSGGTDSAYLLATAAAAGCDIHAYYIKSAFQPQFELEDAKRLALESGVALTVLEIDLFPDEQILSNPADRCYFCKRKLFERIMEAAKNDGYSLLLDGTNASDDASDRPGMRALQELGVRSPLRECGIPKNEVIRRSAEMGLFTANKPAYACLATRIPTGTKITKERLLATEAAEDFLRGLGFFDFRVRLYGNDAKIQVTEAQLEKLLSHRTEIVENLKQYYSSVTLDLEVRS